MTGDQVLAFRLARSGLTARISGDPAAAAMCPASDFHRDAALLSLAARVEGVTQERYRAAVDAGDLVVAHVVRGAIHLVAPGDLARFGRALIGQGDELAAQLGRQVQQLLSDSRWTAESALAEVTVATQDSLKGGRALDKNELHAALRERVDGDLMPWCKGCKSHHVAPMLWRYATIEAGARLDSARQSLPASRGARLLRAPPLSGSCTSTVPPPRRSLPTGRGSRGPTRSASGGS